MYGMIGDNVEILAPAGDMTCLQAALDAGADAVYFGLGEFNMRQRAGINFTVADLPEIKQRCEAARPGRTPVKRYLTLNSIVFEDEIEKIDALIAAAKPLGGRLKTLPALGKSKGCLERRRSARSAIVALIASFSPTCRRSSAPVTISDSA